MDRQSRSYHTTGLLPGSAQVAEQAGVASGESIVLLVTTKSFRADEINPTMYQFSCVNGLWTPVATLCTACRLLGVETLPSSSKHSSTLHRGELASGLL